MWIESHQSLRNHPKIKKAARIAGVNEFEMIGRLHCLWWWALDYAPDGDLTNYSDDDIEAAVDWQGESGLFARALIDCGFNGHGGLIDVTQGSREIHDWHEYGGRLLEKREANKERMKERRAMHVQRTTDAQPSHVQGLHNRTEHTEHTEHTDHAASPRQAAIAHLEASFSQLSGLPLPKRDTDKDKKASAASWWIPLGDIWTLCGKDTDRASSLIEKSYRKLVADSMTVASPKSLVKTATAIYAQNGHAEKEPNWL